MPHSTMRHRTTHFHTAGDQTRRRDILLNGATLSITESLEGALRHLRLPDNRRALWVDAMCIDQEHDAEKNEQIDQMRQIYARTSSVITWLGPAGDNSDVAMQWIQRFGKQAFELRIGSRPELQLRRLLDLVDSHERPSVKEDLQIFVDDLKTELCQNQDDVEHNLRITALDLLFKRPYWSRVWVVQELVSASRTLFVCGTEEVTEEALHHSLRLLRNFRRNQTLKFVQDKSPSETENSSLISIDTHDPIALLKFRRATGPFPLVYLLRSLRTFKATDPRDKVFALLGIASDAEILGLRPDYGKTCEQVYSEVALTLIRNGFYDILALGGSSWRTFGPTWSPDWSIRHLRKPLQERSLVRSISPPTAILEPTFSASGINEKLNPRIPVGTMNTALLLLHGTIIGTVEQLGMCWENGGIGEWLHELNKLSYLATKCYETNECRQKSVWRTAVADQEIRQGQKKPRLSEEKLNVVHEALKSETLSLVQVQILLERGLGDYYEQLQVVAQGRRSFSLSVGFYGVGPIETQAGDELVIFTGAQMPYILRRQTEGTNFQLVGEAYVHGVMDGEVMKGSPAGEVIALV